MTNHNHPNGEQLALFFYQELEPEQNESIEQHLANCQECRQTLDRWSQLKTKLDHALHPEPVSRVGKHGPLHRTFGFSVIINLVAVVLIALGSFYWGSNFGTKDKDDLVTELKNELASIKSALADKQENNVSSDIHQEIEAIKFQLAKKNQLADASNELSRDEFRKLLGQVVAISHQTTRLREEISSLAVNAHAEIERNRKAVTQLYVNSEQANQTFEIPNP